jgi:hypothetical protein
MNTHLLPCSHAHWMTAGLQLTHGQSQSQDKIMLRRTVSLAQSWAQDQSFVTVTQLLICWCGTPFLTRGRICRLQLLLVLASSVRVTRDSWPYFTVSDLRLPQTGGSGPCIYVPQEQGGPVIPPGTGLPFRRLLRLAGQRWRFLNPPPHGPYPGWCPRYIAPARTA